MRVSKGLYMGSIIGGLVGGMILAILGVVFALDRAMDEAAPVFFILAFLAMVYGGVMWCIFLHKIWKSIQDGHARTTPGKAVGFLFIPFFNIYWQFVAIHGFALDYNAYADRYNLQSKRLPVGLFLTSPILVCCSIVPYLGTLASLANMVLMILIVNYAADAVNAIPAAGAAPVPAQPQPPAAQPPAPIG